MYYEHKIYQSNLQVLTTRVSNCCEFYSSVLQGIGKRRPEKKKLYANGENKIVKHIKEKSMGTYRRYRS